MFRSFILAPVAVVSIAAGAVAADLPVRSVAPVFAPVPVFTWTGPYVGAQIGAGWQQDRLAESSICVPACVDRVTGRATGVIGGGHVGFNWQSGPLVVGAEADIEGTGLHHRTIYPLSSPDTFSSEIEWQSSVRGRLGFAVDRTLVYATGGVAFADIRHNYYEASAGISQAFSDVRTGWTVGGGIEYAITDNFTARVEYRYTDFGTKIETPAFVFPGFVENHTETQHAVRVGASYKF
jgi:outer membrane immunogenic protein